MLGSKAEFFHRCDKVQPIKTFSHGMLGIVGKKGISHEISDRVGFGHV